jgi:hypothetical protein
MLYYILLTSPLLIQGTTSSFPVGCPLLSRRSRVSGIGRLVSEEEEINLSASFRLKAWYGRGMENVIEHGYRCDRP